jgi:sulfonate transport system permease protein
VSATISTIRPPASAQRPGLYRRLAATRRLAIPLLLLALWQLAAMRGWLPPRTMPAPSRIVQTFWDLCASGELPRHLLTSLARVAAGLAIGVSAGAVFALVAGLTRLGEDAVDSTLQMVRTLPHLALVPLFILWFGIGETPKVALVALGAMFPIYLNLFAGIRGVDKKIIEAAGTLGLTRAERIRHIILPGALPNFLVGLRYALGLAWLSLVVGEQINATSGIGYLAMSAREFLRTDIIFVALIVYAVLGLLADQIVRALERRALAWRPQFVES